MTTSGGLLANTCYAPPSGKSRRVYLGFNAQKPEVSDRTEVRARVERITGVSITGMVDERRPISKITSLKILFFRFQLLKTDLGKRSNERERIKMN